MEYEELHKLGMDVYLLVKSNEIVTLISMHPYALAFGRDQVEAFNEDFAKAKQEIDFDVSNSIPEIAISNFDTTDFVSLIEIGLQNPDLKSGIKVDLILNQAGAIYIEDVYAYFETH